MASEEPPSHINSMSQPRMLRIVAVMALVRSIMLLNEEKWIGNRIVILSFGVLKELRDPECILTFPMIYYVATNKSFYLQY